ncbi:2-(1,2-epoxy-1,2-dihydrophenyl)acetyl-CoA isomerase PaaG [soil metagenome]
MIAPLPDLQVRDGAGVRTFELGPEKSRNALSLATRRALAEQLSEADRDPSIRVIVVTGAGNAFCSGADITEVPRGYSAVQAYRYMTETSQSVSHVLAGLRTPTIARVAGVAAGAGMFLALGCDVVVAAESARFIPSQLKLGLPPDWSGLWILPKLVGRAKAKAILLRAEPVTARDAMAMGMIAECVADDRLDDVVRDYAARITALPPLAVSLVKDGLDRNSHASLGEFEAWEASAVGLAITSVEYEERVKEFLDKPQASRGPGKATTINP